MKTSTILRNIMILTKNCENSAQFYIDVFGKHINLLRTKD
jgi:catechol-2,3-dioxygenase